MTEKRFKVTDNTNNPFLCDWSVTDYADGGIVHHPMTSENMANVMCELLNELHKENEQLKKELQNLRAKKTYETIELREKVSDETIEKFKEDLKDGNFIELNVPIRKHKNDHISWKGDGE